MRYRVAKISVLQTSKVIAILYALFGLCIVPFGCVFLVAADEPGLRIVSLVYLFMPLIYGVFGFVFVAIGALIYNALASQIGGVEFELENPSGVTPTDAIS
jgi:hypothetical protein